MDRVGSSVRRCAEGTQSTRRRPDEHEERDEDDSRQDACRQGSARGMAAVREVPLKLGGLLTRSRRHSHAHWDQQFGSTA